MYCTKCGKQNRDGDNYCRQCGAPLFKVRPNAQATGGNAGWRAPDINRGPASVPQEDPNVLYETGERYWDGTNGVEQNYEKAVEYYVRAADLGHVDAIYSLGYCYAKGIGINRDIQKAKMLLAYAIDHGSLMAAAKMGDFYYWGEIFPEDKVRGYLYLKYAADNGHAHSMAIVGRDYLTGFGSYEGWGPAKDETLGRQYLEKAAEMGDNYALFEIGHNYCGGFNGFPDDPVKGARYQREAAEGGHAYAQMTYAILCWNGEGVPKNPSEYARWMKASAENGNEEAVVRWAWTRYWGVVESARCKSEREFQECRNILEQALADGEYFMTENKEAMDELHAEEARLGRRIKITDFYGGAAGSGGQSSGGCYIATAIYGSYDCPQVWTLRRYRDHDLASTRRGRAFIKIYYKISPTLVKYFGGSRLFRAFFRKKLDRMVAGLNEKGYEDTPYSDVSM